MRIDSLPTTAGYAALAATATAFLSGVALALFFGGAGAFWGPINDILVAVTLLLIVPAVLVVMRLARGRAGGWFAVISVLAVAGMIEAAAGQLLLVARVISLQTSFVTGGVGFLPFLAWVITLSYVVLRHDLLSRRVAWWAISLLGMIALTTAASAILPWQALTALSVPLFATMAGWLLVLGRELVRLGAGEWTPRAGVEPGGIGPS